MRYSVYRNNDVRFWGTSLEFMRDRNIAPRMSDYYRYKSSEIRTKDEERVTGTLDRIWYELKNGGWEPYVGDVILLGDKNSSDAEYWIVQPIGFMILHDFEKEDQE